MVLFLSKKRRRAGLFLDRGIFRYLEIEGDSGNCAVSNFAAGILPEDFTVGGDPFADSGIYLFSLFDEVISKTGRLSLPVNISLPTTDTLLRIVSMPGMTVSEAKQAFRYQFENFFPFPLSEGTYDIAEIEYPLPNKGSEKRFIAAAARAALIENIMNAASANGIQISAIEPAQIALERSATPRLAPCDAAVYVYAGRISSVLTLSWKGNGVFYRRMSLGFENLPLEPDSENEEAAARSVAFIKEIRLSLQFALSQIRGFEPESVFIFGSAVSDGFCSLMKETLSLPSVIRIDPMRVHGLEFKSEAGNWDIPLGLALR